jgi:DNA-directed RNA polymerase specialized sigma subunit
MTARQIIEELYRSEELRECLSRIKPIDIQEDLLQHCFLELLNKEESVILNLYKENRLNKYVVKMMYNQFWQRNSDFNKLKSKEVYSNDFEHPTEIIKEEIIVPLGKLNWVSEKVLVLYAEHKTYRKVGNITGIPYSTIFRMVKKAKKKIKKLI